jgi:hypothetical protein
MPDTPPDRAARRWQLIRDVLVFSAKVALETARDLVLFPAALIAGLLGVVAGGDRPERTFHQVRAIGARFDEWLNLFGEHDASEEPGIDEQFGKLEQLLVDEYKRGGVTAQAKQAIDRALDTLQEKPGSNKAIASGSAITDKVGKSDS